MGAGLVDGIAFKTANQVDPGSNPLKIWSLDRRLNFKNIIVL